MKIITSAQRLKVKRISAVGLLAIASNAIANAPPTNKDQIKISNASELADIVYSVFDYLGNFVDLIQTIF